MKVLLVGSDTGISGAGLSMIALSKELNKIGVDTALVVRKGNSQRILDEEGIQYHCVQAYAWTEGLSERGVKKYLRRIIKIILNVLAFFHMLKIIHDENVDVVHINTSTTYVGALAAILMRKKLVWHFRELMEEDLGGRFWNKKIVYSILKKSDYNIAISKCVLEKHKPMLGDTPFGVVYNGVDINKYLNIEHKIFQNDKIILTIAGRISANKGQLEILIAMSDLLKQRDDVELWIVGNGTESEKSKLVYFIKECGIPDKRIKFWGYVTNMPEIWSKTDIAIVASKFEAFGRVTVEAMCSGCLLLGANTGGTVELVQNNKTGIIYEQGNPNSLEEKINEILANKEKMVDIAAAGREYASINFTAEKNAREIKRIYDSIIG